MSIKETNVVVDTHSNQRAVLGNTEIRQCIFEGFIALLVEILVEMCVHDGFEVHLLDDRLLLNIELINVTVGVEDIDDSLFRLAECALDDAVLASIRDGGEGEVKEGFGRLQIVNVESVRFPSKSNVLYRLAEVYATNDVLVLVRAKALTCDCIPHFARKVVASSRNDGSVLVHAAAGQSAFVT